MMDPVTLPTDTVLLQHMLQEQQALNQRLLEQISQLTFTIEKLQKLLFGCQSERRSDSKKAENKKANPSSHSPAAEKNTSHLNGRRRLPNELPRVRIEHDVPIDKQHCAACHCPLQRIGEAISEQLDFVPAKLYVKQHVRYKYGCRHCQGFMITADLCLPNRLIKVWLAAVY